jgi:hypothetical protein
MRGQQELFTLTRAGHRLTISRRGNGCRAIYTGWLDGIPLVADRTKGRVFMKLLEMARAA